MCFSFPRVLDLKPFFFLSQFVDLRVVVLPDRVSVCPWPQAYTYSRVYISVLISMVSCVFLSLGL